jgi:hypothetical protein
MLLQHDPLLRKKMESLTLDAYRKQFSENKTKFDVHDRYFQVNSRCHAVLLLLLTSLRQDAALVFTHGKSRDQLNELNSSDNDADRWLMRARSIAISTREDIDWRGNLVFDADAIERKKVGVRRRDCNFYVISRRRV